MSSMRFRPTQKWNQCVKVWFFFALFHLDIQSSSFCNHFWQSMRGELQHAGFWLLRYGLPLKPSAPSLAIQKQFCSPSLIIVLSPCQVPAYIPRLSNLACPTQLEGVDTGDFEAVNAAAFLLSTESSKTIFIAVKDDNLPEADETFTFNLKLQVTGRRGCVCKLLRRCPLSYIRNQMCESC